MEKGNTSNPSVELLKRLANHFKVPVSTLVGEDLAAEGADPDLVRMFRLASESALTGDEKKHLDDMLQSLLRMKAQRKDAD